MSTMPVEHEKNDKKTEEPGPYEDYPLEETKALEKSSS
jgi:hypothetical protein